MKGTWLRQAVACGLMATVAGCAQPGAGPRPPVQAGAAGTRIGPVTSAPGPLTQLTRPRAGGWTLPGQGGGAAAAPPARQAATPQVTDPFAGQGVLRPEVPRAAAARSTPAAPAQPVAAAGPAANSHTVQPGETAWSIARKYGLTVQALAQANGLPETMSVRVGQRLAIPARAAARAEPVRTTNPPGTDSPTPEPPSARKPLPTEKTEPAGKAPPPAEAPDLGKTRSKASGSGRFAMPVNGSIVRAYKKGTNEGIDIAAAAGTPVRAAAAGTVVAVTRDTQGTSIVVVRHDNGLMSVYAGMDGLSVAKGDTVRSGQPMGKARNAGSVHFEIRKGFDSVDPEEYL